MKQPGMDIIVRAFTFIRNIASCIPLRTATFIRITTCALLRTVALTLARHADYIKPMLYSQMLRREPGWTGGKKD